MNEATGERDAQCCCPWSGRGTWTLFDFRPSDPVFATADHRQFDGFGSQVRLWPRGHPRALRALSAPVHLPTGLAHGPPWLALHPQLVTASVRGAFAPPSRRPRPFEDLGGRLARLAHPPHLGERGLVNLPLRPLGFEFGYDLLELFASHLRRGSNLHYTFPVLIASAARG
jgi:hypothetical protein